MALTFTYDLTFTILIILIILIILLILIIQWATGRASCRRSRNHFHLT